MKEINSLSDFMKALGAVTQIEAKDSTDLFHDLYWHAKNIDHNKIKWDGDKKNYVYQEFRELSRAHLEAVAAKWLK